MRHCSRHPVGLRLRLQLGLAVAISDLDLYLQDDLKFRGVGS